MMKGIASVTGGPPRCGQRIHGIDKQQGCSYKVHRSGNWSVPHCQHALLAMAGSPAATAAAAAPRRRRSSLRWQSQVPTMAVLQYGL